MQKLITVVLLIIFVHSYSQNNPGKRLSISDFEDWKTIKDQRISDDGKIVVYEMNPQKGDGTLFINKIENQNSDTIPRGKNAMISSDNNTVVFKIAPPEQVVRKAKKKKVKKEEMPMDSVGIYHALNGNMVKYARCQKFVLPEEGGEWVALLLKPAEVKDTIKSDEKKKKKKKEVKQVETDLLMYHTKTGDTLNYKHVTEFVFSKNGEQALFISQTKDTSHTFSEVRLFDTKRKVSQTVYKSIGWADKIALDDGGANYAFLFSTDTIKEKEYKLFHGTIKGSAPAEVVSSKTDGMPDGWAPSINGKVYFSEDGNKLFFGNAPIPEPEKEDSLLAEEKPKLDIWNWKDIKLQSQQKVELKTEKKRTYLAAYHVHTAEFVQLADKEVNSVRLIQKGNGDIALGTDRSNYQRSSSWTGKRSGDHYLINVRSGDRSLILKEKSWVRISPAGEYVIWYNPQDRSYYSMATKNNNTDTVSLTKLLPVKFYNELNDRPQEPSPYGIAGWTKDDKFVLIYDRYDIWKIDPSGKKAAVSLTNGFGRLNKIRLRYVRLDREEEFIPSSSPMLLKAFHEETMSAGFFNARINKPAEPLLLMMEDYMFSNPVKSKGADKIMWTKENVGTFPNIWYSDRDFNSSLQISNANPQQKEFVWPTVKLVEWNSFSGEKLKGMLYKPENFDPDKKYPVVVYYYERRSQSLHRHYQPAPSRSTINRTFYTSNDYLVFVPDITYRTGYPGQSAYNSVVSGVSYLITTFPFVDKDRIGLQGQSWGGYQTAYIITQTDMFAAAMGGAVVSNMISAYGGIRWGTGLSRMFQYEHQQSRIGGTLWEKPLLYMENSPLFYAPKVNTPILMMHNDKDDAVPWYQGIEFFVALRRLNKPVWMLNYNGEPHNLKGTSWANRIDLSTRMFQFFNHYLKGEPMPGWMESGVPAIEKGKNLGY